LPKNEDDEERKVPEERKEPEEVQIEPESTLPPRILHARMLKSQREVISIHVGGAGVNLGGALWDLFCVEHGIDPEGNQNAAFRSTSSDNIQKNFFFNDKKSGKMVPRSIFIDLEPSTYLDPFRIAALGNPAFLSPMDKIRTGPFRNLFEPD